MKLNYSVEESGWFLFVLVGGYDGFLVVEFISVLGKSVFFV